MIGKTKPLGLGVASGSINAEPLRGLVTAAGLLHLPTAAWSPAPPFFSLFIFSQLLSTVSIVLSAPGQEKHPGSWKKPGPQPLFLGGGRCPLLSPSPRAMNRAEPREMELPMFIRRLCILGSAFVVCFPWFC